MKTRSFRCSSLLSICAKEPFLVMKSLRALGAVVALDDLGESHSGLRRWTELEPDVVKIDMFFTQGISTNPRKLEFVRAIASLGETLGTVLVEIGRAHV